LEKGGFDPLYLAISFVLLVGLTIVTFVFYRKRDMNI